MTSLKNGRAVLATMIISAIALAGGSQGGLAQDTAYTGMQASAGKALRVAYYATSGANCSAGVPPEVRIVEPPKSGTLLVREAVLNTNRVANCPGLKLPTRVLFYTSRGDFSGKDRLVYEVVPAKGPSRRYDVTVDVKPGQPVIRPNDGQKI